MNNKPEVEQTGIPAVSFDEFKPTDYETWKEAATAALKGAPFDKKLFTKTYEGITLEPIYTAEHLKENTSEYPGCKDFMRGTKASGYIERPWDIAQAADGILPEDVNKTLIQELEKGSSAVHLKLSKSVLEGGEMPRGAGFVPQHAGLLLSNLKDIDDTLKGIDLTKTPIHVYTGGSSASVLGLIAARAVAKGTGDELKAYSGCVGADPIAQLADSGESRLELMYDEMAEVMRWTKENMPNMRTVLIQGNSCYHNAGACAVQEVSYCFGHAVSYIEAMLERGLDIDTIAGQIRFCFSIGANFFMEIAKLRAARLLWAQITEAYGADEQNRKIDIFARTSYFTETVYDPYVNILRATTQTFSGVVGGVSAMQVAPFDEAIGLSDEHSRRVARNIQIMFQQEFDMLQPVDPAGGSWYVESLTDQLAAAIWEGFQKICADGGIVELLKNGTIQKQIGEVLKSRQDSLAFRKEAAVGTNMYANMTEKLIEKTPPDLQKIKAAREKSAAEFLKGIDTARRDKCIKELSSNKGGLIPAIIEAFVTGAGAEQIRAALDNGAKITAEPISSHRWTENFEALRMKTAEFKSKSGSSVKVFLANMGPIPQHKARADFITGFMEVAEFEVLKNDGFQTVEEAAKAAIESGADAVVICSTDKTYPELVPALAKLIKAEMPDIPLYLAGAPAAEFKDSYLEAGVDDFIHVKSNCFTLLENIQKKKGVL